MQLTRKLRQIIDAKIPEYLYKRYPYLIQFLYGFVEFVDQEAGIDALNLTRNLDPNTIFDKFVNDYFEQYCVNLIDTDKYQLTDENKRLFLSICKFLYNNKGKKLSFEIALQYLTQFFVYADDNYVENIDYEIIENVYDWIAVQTTPPAPAGYNQYRNGFTYIIKGDFRKSLIVAMIEKLNPVGFYPEFHFSQYATELYSLINASDVTDINTTFSPKPIDTYRNDLNIDEIFSISSSGEEDHVEFLKHKFKRFIYNGARKYDGSRKYNAIDSGTIEQYDIVSSNLGVPFDTFTYSIG